MKTLIITAALLTLILQLGCTDSTTSPEPSKQGEGLAPLADKALNDGKEAKLNVGFAKTLGLEATSPLALRRLQMEKDGAVYMVNVPQTSPDFILFSERREALSTFYVADKEGKLKKAVVNDGSIRNGGLTNLAISVASDGFSKQKELWLQWVSDQK